MTAEPETHLLATKECREKVAGEISEVEVLGYNTKVKIDGKDYNVTVVICGKDPCIDPARPNELFKPGEVITIIPNCGPGVLVIPKASALKKVIDKKGGTIPWQQTSGKGKVKLKACK